MINIKDISSKKLNKDFYLIPYPKGERVKVIKGLLRGLEVIYNDITYILDRWDLPDSSFVDRRSSIIRNWNLAHGLIYDKKDIRHSLLPAYLARGYNSIIRKHEKFSKVESLKGSLVVNPLGLYEKTTKKNLNRIFIPKIIEDYGLLIATNSKDTLFIDHRIHGILKAKVKDIDEFEYSIFDPVTFGYSYRDGHIDVLYVNKLRVK